MLDQLNKHREGEQANETAKGKEQQDVEMTEEYDVD